MLNASKVISTALKDAKRFVKILRFGRDDVQDIREAMPFGYDGNPHKDMVAIYGATSEKGKPVIIGYINKNQIADIGETRIYSTNETGDEKIYLHLKNDGSAEFGGDTDFMVRFNKLKDGYDALKSDFNSFVTTYNTHTHPYVGLVAGVSGTTLATPSAGTPSSASIDDSKIEEIKTL